VAPGSPAAGTIVTFDGSASSDPDGSIASYMWDLDGNGSLEVDTGTQPTTTKSYPATGSVTARLRVTDSNGGITDTTRTFTVSAPQNQVPTAAFTAPAVVLAGEPVSFDGSASSDPDGSIAGYKWDLDGDGAFETDTGTAAMTSRSYSAAGTVTVRLRVTDNGGAVGEASHAVIVNAVNVPPAPAPITAPPQPVFPPAATGQQAPTLPSCSSIRRQRSKLVSKRNAARRKLAKAKTKATKKRYGAEVRALSRKISKLAKARCSA
jgi:PKD repeat protein